jgi:hypothetical protein
LEGALTGKNSVMDKLESIGYNDWFRNQVDEGKIAAHEVARVVAVHKDSCVSLLVDSGNLQPEIPR